MTRSVSALIALLVFSLSLSAQKFPGSIVTLTDIGVATDNATTKLTASIGPTDLIIPVTHGSGTQFQIGNIVTMDGTEKTKLCAVSADSVTACQGFRGMGGTTGAAHLHDAVLECRINSTYWQNMAAELPAIETAVAALQAASVAPATDFYQFVQYNSNTPLLPQRIKLNFLPGPNAAIDVQDDPAHNATNILIDSLCSPGTGGSNYQFLQSGGVATPAAPTLNFLTANANLTIVPTYNAGTNTTDLLFTATGGASASNYQTVQINGVSQTAAATVNFAGAGVSGSTSGGVTTVNIAASGTATSGTVTSSTSAPDPSKCFNGAVGSFWQVTGAQPSLYACNVTGTAYTWTPLTVHAIGAIFDDGGPVLSVGETKYFTVPFACTIQAWNMTVIGGTSTIGVWKLATGTAVPTSSNSITASATPAIATGNALHSATLTGWTTAVAKDDIFGFHLNAVSGATQASLVLQCQ